MKLLVEVQVANLEKNKHHTLQLGEGNLTDKNIQELLKQLQKLLESWK